MKRSRCFLFLVMLLSVLLISSCAVHPPRRPGSPAPMHEPYRRQPPREKPPKKHKKPKPPKKHHAKKPGHAAQPAPYGPGVPPPGR